MTLNEKIVNLETGEITIRNYTAEEITEVEAAREKSLLEIAEAEAKAAERQAILDRLGITAEEAQLLLGGN